LFNSELRNVRVLVLKAVGESVLLLELVGAGSFSAWLSAMWRKGERRPEKF
jgi:hypothetical protein